MSNAERAARRAIDAKTEMQQRGAEANEADRLAREAQDKYYKAVKELAQALEQSADGSASKAIIIDGQVIVVIKGSLVLLPILSSQESVSEMSTVQL